MLLVIIVVLIFIELWVTSSIFLHFSTRVIGASVLFLVVFRRKIPCMISLFHTVKGDEFNHRVLAKISSLQEIRIEFSRSTVDISFRTDVRQSALNAPMSAHQACTEAHRLFMREIRATCEVESSPRLQPNIFGLHVHRSTKCASAISRCANTTLHLDASKARSEVAHVYPIELATFGIVQRNAVGGNVNTASIGATNAQSGVSHAVSGIASGNHRGHSCEQKRDVAPSIKTLNLLLCNVGKGHWRFLRCTRGHHLHILQLVTAKRIEHFMFGIGCISHCNTCECCNQGHCFFHFPFE